jgi:mono/diheme cytochrome c family protein
MKHEADAVAELAPAERDELWAWANADVPHDFSARMGAIAAAARQTEASQSRWGSFGWAGALALAAGILVTLWLAHDARSETVAAPVVAAAVPPADLAALREDVRLLLAEHCVPCHARDAEGAKHEALAIFEVDDPAWAGRLEETQLEITRERFGSMDLGATTEARVDAFVERELEWRRQGAG